MNSPLYCLQVQVRINITQLDKEKTSSGCKKMSSHEQVDYMICICQLSTIGLKYSALLSICSSNVTPALCLASKVRTEFPPRIIYTDRISRQNFIYRQNFQTEFCKQKEFYLTSSIPLKIYCFN